jgi:Na+-driven multidrug efflux pump
MQKVDLTAGGEVKTLVNYSLPFIAATIIQALFNVTDIIVIGRFSGAADAAGAGVAGQLLYLIVNAAVGLGAGGTILIGRAAGENDLEKAKEYIAGLFVVFLVLGAAASVLGYFFGGYALKLLKTPAESMAAAEGYVKTAMAGLVFVFIYNALSSVLRGLGDSILPLIIISVAFVLNVGSDLLTIGVFKMGGKGAALSTVLSEALASVVAAVVLIKRKRSTALRISKLRLPEDPLRNY